LSHHKIPIIQIGFLDSIDDINQTIANVSKALGNDELGIALVDDLNRRLLSVPNIKTKSAALYIAAGGVTTGKGTLVHDIMSKGNLRNIVDTPGWSDIPLEQLVSLRPDVIVHSYLGDLTKKQWKMECGTPPCN
jgi:iron complex transport system substrate-binding protein